MNEYEKIRRNTQIKEHAQLKKQELKQALEKRKMQERINPRAYSDGRDGR